MKTCSACGHENRDEAKFCTSCGAAFAQTSLYSGGPDMYDPQGADESKRCPKCGTNNPADAIYCRGCGNPLHPGASHTADADFRSGSAGAKSGQKGLWILLAVILIAAVGGGAWYYQSAHSENAGDESVEIKTADSRESSDQGDSSYAEDMEDSDIRKEIEPAGASGIELNLPEYPAEDYFSAVAVLQTIMDDQGSPLSSQQAASLLGANGKDVTDYQKLADVLNRSLENRGVSHLYSGIYSDLGSVDSTAEQLFAGRIHQALSEGLPAVVVIGKDACPGLGKNAYSLVSGEDNGFYTLMIPTSGGTVYQTLSLDDLLGEMELSGFLCYLA